MNERIKELAEQAKLYDGWFCGNGNIEKFAESIVRECIEVSQVGSITEDKLKRHFGVE